QHSFYELIVNKARGKSGPLFHFDVHEDVRTIADATVEKDESHAGKVVERHWYEKNKHIFPASRWESTSLNMKLTYDRNLLLMGMSLSEMVLMSRVSSIGLGQTGTMSGGPDQHHNSHVVSEGPDQDHNSNVVSEGQDQDYNSHVMLGGPLANTEELRSEGVEAKPDNPYVRSPFSKPKRPTYICFNIGPISGTRHPNILELETGETMINPQPEREWVQGVEEEGMGMGSWEGPTALALLVKTTHSSTFIKENIESWRTLIGERDQHDKIGETPKQLTCDESEREESEGPQYAKQLYEKSLISGTMEKEFLVNFSMEIPERRFRSSYGSPSMKGARRSSSSRSLKIRKN
nr:protein XAP5 circadian timekeeper [Tanacetum cinerariifolium]